MALQGKLPNTMLDPALVANHFLKNVIVLCRPEKSNIFFMYRLAQALTLIPKSNQK